ESVRFEQHGNRFTDRGLVVYDAYGPGHPPSLSIGSFITTRAPRADVAMERPPPCASAIERATARPSPEPSGLVVVNGAGSLTSKPGGKPGPSSRTSISTSSLAETPTRVSTVPPRPAPRMASAALTIKL